MEEPVINQPTNMISRSNLSGLEKLVDTKGQIISECPYEIIVYPKIATKNFRDFCPSL